MAHLSPNSNKRQNEMEFGAPTTPPRSHQLSDNAPSSSSSPSSFHALASASLSPNESPKRAKKTFLDGPTEGITASELVALSALSQGSSDEDVVFALSQSSESSAGHSQRSHADGNESGTNVGQSNIWTWKGDSRSTGGIVPSLSEWSAVSSPYNLQSIPVSQPYSDTPVSKKCGKIRLEEGLQSPRVGQKNNSMGVQQVTTPIRSLFGRYGTEDIGNLPPHGADFHAQQEAAKGIGPIKDFPSSPGLDAIWAAVKIVMPSPSDDEEQQEEPLRKTKLEADDQINPLHFLEQAVRELRPIPFKKGKPRSPRPPKSPNANSNSSLRVNTTDFDAAKTVLSPANSMLSCNCRRTRCLKLYCDCFRFKRYCSRMCNCSGCSNIEEHEDERRQVMEAIMGRNPGAFKPKVLSKSGDKQHLIGCHCKRSACLKKYCECYTARVPCNSRCRCIDCHNTPDSDHFKNKFVPSRFALV